MLYIGIDPGLRGAIVGLNEAGNIDFVWDMPRCSSGVDVDVLADMMKELGKRDIASLYIEKPFYKTSDRVGENGKRNMSIQNQLTARINSGVVFGMAKMISANTKLVEPIMWRRGVGVPDKSGKEGSIKIAQTMWPSCVALRHSKDGRADAALISDYGMRVEKLLSLVAQQERTR